MLRKNLREAQFFFWIHYHTPPWDSMRLLVSERQWFIDRFIEFKEKEAAEIKKSQSR